MMTSGCGSAAGPGVGAGQHPLSELRAWSIDRLTCSGFRTLFSKQSSAPAEANLFSVLLSFPSILSPSRSPKSRSLFANNLAAHSIHPPPPPARSPVRHAGGEFCLHPECNVVIPIRMLHLYMRIFARVNRSV